MGPQIKWDDDLRFGLLQVSLKTTLTKEARRNILNEIFEQKIRTDLQGRLLNKIDDGRLNSQVAERETNGRKRWLAVLSPPSSRGIAARRLEITEQINAIIARSSATAITTNETRSPPRTFVASRITTAAKPSRGTVSPRSRKALKRLLDEPATPESNGRVHKRNNKTRATMSATFAMSTMEQTDVLLTPAPTPQSMKTIRARRNGPPLAFTDAEYAVSQTQLEAVPSALASPVQQGLCYRVWDEETYGINDENGFVAGRFHLTNSVSNSLVWAIRLALKRAKKGRTNSRITFLDAESLGAVYHVHPLAQKLKKTKCFTEGAWNYGGVHEFVVWAEIKHSAILKTVHIDELVRLCGTKPTLAVALSFDILGGSGDFEKIWKQLKAKSEGLSIALVSSTASLGRFLGLSGESPLKHIEHFVSDLIQGWKVKIEYKSRSEWAEAAKVFAQVLCGRRSVPSIKLMGAFLAGVRAGMGDRNTLLSADKIRLMYKRAAAVGIADLSAIMLHSLQQAQLEMQDYDRDLTQRIADAATSWRMLETNEQMTSTLKTHLDGKAVDDELGYEEENEDELAPQDDSEETVFED